MLSTPLHPTQVRKILAVFDPNIGEGKVQGALFSSAGLRVKRARVREALRRCDDVRDRTERRMTTRRSWYEAIGPMFICCMDQNEKLGHWGFKILGAIDGYSRYPLAWTLTPTLTGRDHSALYHKVLRDHNEAPRHVVVDGTQCFNGVKEAQMLTWGIDAEPCPLPLDDGVILVSHFQQTSSVHNTPIERFWGDLNIVTKK